MLFPPKVGKMSSYNSLVIFFTFGMDDEVFLMSFATSHGDNFFEGHKERKQGRS